MALATGKDIGRSDRSVSDRLQRLETGHAASCWTSHFADMAFGAIPDSEPIACKVDRHCRTRVFHYPGAQGSEPLPYVLVHESDGIRAYLACDLIACFEDLDSVHYAEDPTLRHDVVVLSEQRKAQGNALTPCLIVEQTNDVVPLALEGCALVPEAPYKDEDGKPMPLLAGGREHEKFVAAMKTIDAPWPEAPNGEPFVNLILAAARAVQDECFNMAKHLDQECWLTTDGQLVKEFPFQLRPGRLELLSELNEETFRQNAATLRLTIDGMTGDLGSEHIRLLFDALYWDDERDDEFRRLHYLRLWQSLAECRRKLGHHGDMKGEAVVAGTTSLADLTEYRNAIAHWWTGAIDDNLLAGIYRTINELIRRKYTG